MPNFTPMQRITYELQTAVTETVMKILIKERNENKACVHDLSLALVSLVLGLIFNYLERLPENIQYSEFSNIMNKLAQVFERPNETVHRLEKELDS